MHHRHSIDDTQLLALLHAYLAARYRWRAPADWQDLAIGRPAPLIELHYPDAESFGLLSAWNPMSQLRPARENRRADRALKAELAASGLHHVPALARAPDHGWREAGWLVSGMPADAFDRLIRRFGQLGALWWSRGTAVRLRIDARRPDGLAGDGDVDWLH